MKLSLVPRLSCTTSMFAFRSVGAWERGYIKLGKCWNGVNDKYLTDYKTKQHILM